MPGESKRSCIQRPNPRQVCRLFQYISFAKKVAPGSGKKKFMKIGMLGLFLLFTSVAHAQVQFEPVRQILMTGRTCEELRTHAGAIAEWTYSLTKNHYEIPECYCSSSSCQMDVAAISPYLVKEFTIYDSGFSLSSAYSGPNCFNAVLVSTRTLPQVTYTHPVEMTATLRSSLCAEVPVKNPLLAGDILVVRDQRERYLEIHAGIYLNDTLSFSKYGEVNLMPYTYGTNVDKAYGVHDERCRRVQGIPAAGDTCYEKPFVNFFRCTPLYSFVSHISKSPQGLNKEAQKMYAQISSLDSTISGIAFKGDKVDAEKLMQLQTRLQALASAAAILSQDLTVDAGNREFIRLMHFRLYSLYDQTRIVARSIKATELVAPLMAPPQ